MALRSHGHAVRAVDSGESGLSALADADSIPPTDLVVLDVMLPGIDGVETARRIRAGSSVPILMLTARDSDLDIVVGLEAGADDYVIKPVESRVLDARIKALLRRAERGADDRSEGTERWGELTISRSTLIVTRSGQPVDLSPTELRVLLVLSASPGQVLSRLQLLELVWEQDYLGDSRLVDATIQRLRAKIETDPAAPRFIQTVRGFGYRFGPL
jgi:DNA-binding response OmpR family regulator